MQKTLAYDILKQVKFEDVPYVFMVPGKNIVPFLSAIDEFEGYISGIVCSSELGAGFMADGYSRVTNKFGAVITISSAGFNNLFGAIANAYSDSSKLLILCGSSDSRLNGKNSFQDGSLYKADCSIIANNLCSYSCNLNEASLNNQLNNAFFYLKNYNLPVFVQVPVDLQMINSNIKIDSKYINKNFLNQNALMRIQEIIENKDEFIIVTGNNAAAASDEIRKFCEEYHIALASTLCSKGIVSEYADFYLGIFGFAMSPRIHNLLVSSQVKYIITIGFDHTERNTSKWRIYDDKTIIHLDNMIYESSRDYAISDEVFLTDIQVLFNYLLTNNCVKNTLKSTINKRKDMLKDLNSRIPYHISLEHSDMSLLYADQVIQSLNKKFLFNCNIVVDSGSYRLYCAHLWKTNSSKSYYTSINNGHMGWAIAASVGVKLGSPKKDCICITGDGCMLMNGIEIQTAAKYNVKVLFVVINNNAHGAMRSKTLSNNNYKIPDHDWTAFAKALGVNAKTITSLDELDVAIEIFKTGTLPFLLDIKCTYDENINLNYYYYYN